MTSGDIIRERFSLGRKSGLHAMEFLGKEKRTSWFHESSRADGLEKRVEIFGHSVEEWFSHRKDRVVYRRLEVSKDVDDHKSASKITMADEDDDEYVILRIIEEYSRCPEIDPDDGIIPQPHFLV